MTTKRQPGRHTILTDELQTLIVTAVRSGNYLDDSARYAGIAESTLHLWLHKGRDYRDARDNGTTLTDRQLQYVSFMEAIEKARSDAVVRNVALIQRAAEENWQAAAWYLERTNPKKWGRHHTVEVTGEDGGPLRVEHSTVRESLAAKFAQAELAARAAIEASLADDDDEGGTPILRALGQ